MNWSEFFRSWVVESESRGFSTEILGEFEGVPLVASEKGGDGPVVYLSAGIHGDEPAGPMALIGLLREGFFGDGIRWMVCPGLNPVGLSKGSRENGDGLDLNRDYLERRTGEVVSHIGWLEKRPTPGLFLSLHEDWESSGFYFYEINLGERSPGKEFVLDVAGGEFEVEPELVIDDHEVTELGWIYHEAEPDIPEGWPEAIYLAKRGCGLSLTFETPSSSELERRLRCHQELVRRVVEWYCG